MTGSLLSIGLCGKSNIEQLQVDQVVETVSDLLTEMIKPVFEKDAAKKVCNNYDRMWLIQMLDQMRLNGQIIITCRHHGTFSS